MGKYEESYRLIACVDASKLFYGVVVYIQAVNSNVVKFLYAKNRIITKSLKIKSIPILELIACQFGVKCLAETKYELSNATCPIIVSELHVYTDSMISLNWIHSKAVEFGKIEKKSSLINNRLDSIVGDCEKFPMIFHHIDGKMNPADLVTRTLSPRLLIESNYLSGARFDELEDEGFSVPCLSGVSSPSLCMTINTNYIVPIINLSNYSSFRKICKIIHVVRLFINNLKVRVHKSKPELFSNIKSCNYADSVNYVISVDQRRDFKDVFDYTQDPDNRSPQIVSQLNLFLDSNSIIRVRGKMDRLEAPYDLKYPILIHRNSHLAKCIINDLHLNTHHAGIYKILNLLRKEFYIPSAYSVVKSIVNSCVFCKRFNGRPVKINQNSYREFRVNPSHHPFRDIALDHVGPFTVKNSIGHCSKIYLLLITCLYTRAINLIICHDINNKSFLQALQIHVHEFGMFQTVISDNGSPIVSSLEQVRNYLSSLDIANYLKEHNIKILDFAPYPPGSSYLGGIVESLVKQVKHLMYKATSRTILKFDEFVFLVSECKMLVNKRPIVYKGKLSNVYMDMGVITPETLLHGYDVPSLSIVPQMDSEDRDFASEILPNENKLYDSLDNLRKSKLLLDKVYYGEFIQNLRSSSLNKSGRYESKACDNLEKGDLVLIRQKLIKPYFHPLAVVTDTEVNSLGETNTVIARKGNGELVRRHVTELVLLEKCTDHSEVHSSVPDSNKRVKRKAAEKFNTKLKDWNKNNLI